MLCRTAAVKHVAPVWDLELLRVAENYLCNSKVPSPTQSILHSLCTAVRASCVHEVLMAPHCHTRTKLKAFHQEELSQMIAPRMRNVCLSLPCSMDVQASMILRRSVFMCNLGARARELVNTRRIVELPISTAHTRRFVTLTICTCVQITAD